MDALPSDTLFLHGELPAARLADEVLEILGQDARFVFSGSISSRRGREQPEPGERDREPGRPSAQLSVQAGMPGALHMGHFVIGEEDLAISTAVARHISRVFKSSQ